MLIKSNVSANQDFKFSDSILHFLRALVCLICLTTPVATASGSAPRESRAADGPKADVVETRYDFGEVFTGEAVTHTFSVRNAGTTVLQLSDSAIPKRASASLYRPDPAGGAARPNFVSFRRAPLAGRPTIAAPGAVGSATEPGAAPS